jgi:hypothetical protein
LLARNPNARDAAPPQRGVLCPIADRYGHGVAPVAVSFCVRSWTNARSGLAFVLPATTQRRAQHVCRLSPATGNQPRGRPFSPHPPPPNPPCPAAPRRGRGGGCNGVRPAQEHLSDSSCASLVHSPVQCWSSPSLESRLHITIFLNIGGR